jgi:ribosomal-protein-alanine N-acetyltransferase
VSGKTALIAAGKISYDPPVPEVPWTQQVPRLAGGLTSVREVVACDAPTLLELLTDPVVTEYLYAPPPSVDAFSGFIAWAQQERAAGRSVCFGIVPHGLEAAVGIVQVRALEPTFFTAEWGFAIGAAFWSTGVFMEAANLVVEFAFTTLKVQRLEARAVCQNARGQGALQKLGARAEATLSRAFRKDQRRDEQFLWTLREEDWRERAAPRRRQTADETNAQISRAIAEVQQSLNASRLKAPDPSPRLYPFFLTDSNES